MIDDTANLSPPAILDALTDSLPRVEAASKPEAAST
jgi:hypothetical protein